eukprot:Rhum_TRINITY_DN15426_c0_g1::Rhum_TRINITY_DN15426_c0_g1_i3::g.155078::m.155078
MMRVGVRCPREHRVRAVRSRQVEAARVRCEEVMGSAVRSVPVRVAPGVLLPAVRVAVAVAVAVAVVGVVDREPAGTVLRPLHAARRLGVRRVVAVVPVHALAVVVSGPVAPHHAVRARPPEHVRAVRRQRRTDGCHGVDRKRTQRSRAGRVVVRDCELLPSQLVLVRVRKHLRLTVAPVCVSLAVHNEVLAGSSDEGVVVEVVLVVVVVLVDPLPVVALELVVEAVRRADNGAHDAGVRRLPHVHSRRSGGARQEIVARVAGERVGHRPRQGLLHLELVLLRVALEVVRPLEPVAAVLAAVVLVLRVQDPAPEDVPDQVQVVVQRVVDPAQAQRRRHGERRAVERRHRHHREVSNKRVRALAAVRVVAAEVRARESVPVPPLLQVLLRQRLARREAVHVHVRVVLQLVEQLIEAVRERVVARVSVRVVSVRVAVRVRVRVHGVLAAVDALVHGELRVAGHHVVAAVAVQHIVAEVQGVVGRTRGRVAREVQVLHDGVVSLIHVVQRVDSQRVVVAEQQHQVLRHHLDVRVQEGTVVSQAHIGLETVTRKHVVVVAAVQRVLAALQHRRVAQRALLRLVRVQLRRQQRQAELHVDPPGDGGFAQRLQLRHVHVHERVVHGKVTDKHVVAVTTRQLIVAVQLLLVADRVGHDRRERLHRRRHRSVRARQVLGTNRTEHQQVVVADHRADCGVLQHPHGTRTRRLLRQHIERHADHSAEEVDVQRRHGLGRREQTDRLRHQRHRRVVVVRAREAVAVQEVVAFVAEQLVVAALSDQHVIAGATVDLVVT